MVKVIPFAAWRPAPEQAQTFACPPYDVLSRSEAAELAPDHRFLSVIRPDAAFPADIDEDAPEVHEHARKNLADFRANGTLIHDPEPLLYVYQQTGFDHTQTGIVACVRVADYNNGTIKQHEKTLIAKELNRIHHFEATNAQTEPVFLMHRDNEQVRHIVDRAIANTKPTYDFTGDDGVHHAFWPLNAAESAALVQAFEEIDALYIADGHHRSASAVKVAGNRGLDEDDPRASIMAVIFPADDLKVLAYHRVVADMAGMSEDEFIDAVRAAGYEVTVTPEQAKAQPSARGEFGIYIGASKTWYHIRYTGEQTGNVVEDLDTSILTRTILQPTLSIADLRTDSRISFVGGSAGADGLEGAAGDTGIAFSLYPTATADIMGVSDAGEIMPPKSTWFEPKLASGLFIHDLA